MQDDVHSAVPRTDHQEEDVLLFRKQSPGRRRVPRAITTRKMTCVDKQSRITPKNLTVAHPVQGSQADEGSRGTCSPATPCTQRYEAEKPEGC